LQALCQLPIKRLPIVWGQENKKQPPSVQLIAAILTAATGQENKPQCNLCKASKKSLTKKYPHKPTKAFVGCFSIGAERTPERFKACANHYWIGAVTDCNKSTKALNHYRDTIHILTS
jgi:hypothetical protein